MHIIISTCPRDATYCECHIGYTFAVSHTFVFCLFLKIWDEYKNIKAYTLGVTGIRLD